jgi:ABC-type nitrate/sulfonate/bicarbonate transport system ATPase subunit
MEAEMPLAKAMVVTKEMRGEWNSIVKNCMKAVVVFTSDNEESTRLSYSFYKISSMPGEKKVVAKTKSKRDTEMTAEDRIAYSNAHASVVDFVDKNQ